MVQAKAYEGQTRKQTCVVIVFDGLCRKCNAAKFTTPHFAGLDLVLAPPSLLQQGQARYNRDR